MIVLDMQPASIVEDKGFPTFIEVVDSKYIPPSRRTIMRSLLPDVYGHRKQCLMGDLAAVKFCAITTALWTAVTNESHLTVSYRAIF